MAYNKYNFKFKYKFNFTLFYSFNPWDWKLSKKIISNQLRCEWFISKSHNISEISETHYWLLYIDRIFLSSHLHLLKNHNGVGQNLMNLNAVTYCRKCLKIDLSRFLRFLAFKYFQVRDPTTLIVSQTRCERSHQTFIPTRGLLERKYRSWNSFLNRIVSGPKLLSSSILLSTLHEIERYESGVS